MMTLDKQTLLYQKMLAALEIEKERTVKSDIKGLSDAYMEKQALVIEISQLEKDRKSIMKQLSRDNDHIEPDCSLTLLSKTVNEPFASGLKKRCTQLRGIVGDVRLKNNANRNLLSYSVDLVQASLNLLGNLSNSGHVYMRDGATRDVESYRGRKLFCESI